MKKSDPKKVVFIDYLKPKNWFVLVLLIIARLIAFFPIKVIQSFGGITGILLYQIPSNRKNIAKKNIAKTDSLIACLKFIEKYS